MYTISLILMLKWESVTVRQTWRRRGGISGNSADSAEIPLIISVICHVIYYVIIFDIVYMYTF